MPTQARLNNDFARYIFNMSKVQPGDVLLSRIPMDLDNETTWDSHLIRALTRSSFSFAALCTGNGLFIEAVGTGIARLPLWNAGVRDIRNIRIVRPRKEFRWAAIRAAAAGSGYLERGFYQAGAPRPKCTAFQDVRRAAAASSDIVVNAYLEAGLPLKATSATEYPVIAAHSNPSSCSTISNPSSIAKPANDSKKPWPGLFAGDLVESAFFEDVTHHVLQPLGASTRAVFNLDDDTLRQRIHHWEVETQLKVLCKYEVRRILELKSEKPSSLAELENLIATNQWRSLDAALHHSLRWYRYDKLYRLKQDRLLNDIALYHDRNQSVLNDGLDILEVRDSESDAFNLIEMEANYCRRQRDRYRDLIGAYKGSSFYYMHDLFSELEAQLSRMVSSFNERKESSLLMDNFMADYVYRNNTQYQEGITHKKYYEIN